MGDRGQVEVIQRKGSVFLYTHWEGSKLLSTVYKALSRKQRWGDEEYLTRIIFSEMIKDSVEEETGYGIGLSEHSDISAKVVVNTNDHSIYYESYGKRSFVISWVDFVEDGPDTLKEVGE